MRTALHRYLELSDDVRNEAVFEELISLFALTHRSTCITSR
jgi:hypothetical protein